MMNFKTSGARLACLAAFPILVLLVCPYTNAVSSCVSDLTDDENAQAGLDPIAAQAYLDLTREIEGAMTKAEEYEALGEVQFRNLAALGVFHTAVLKVLAANGARSVDQVTQYLGTVNTLTERGFDDLVFNIVATMIRDNDPELEMSEIADLQGRLAESKTASTDYQAFHRQFQGQIEAYFNPFEAQIRKILKKQDPKFTAVILDGRRNFLRVYQPMTQEALLISRNYDEAGNVFNTGLIERHFSGTHPSFKNYFIGHYMSDLSLAQLESLLTRYSSQLKPQTKVQAYERLYELYTKALYESFAKNDQATERQLLTSLKAYFKQTGYARWNDFVKTYYSLFELPELRDLVADPAWQRTTDAIRDEVLRYLDHKQVDELGREMVRYNEEALRKVKANGRGALSGEALIQYFDRNIQLAAQLSTKKPKDKALDIMNRIFAELIGREKDHHRVSLGNRDHACLGCRTAAGPIWEVEKITEMAQLLKMEYEMASQSAGYSESVSEKILQGMLDFKEGNYALADKYLEQPESMLIPSKKDSSVGENPNFPHVYDALRNNIEVARIFKNLLKSPRYQALLTFFIYRLEAEISRGESGAYAWIDRKTAVESLEISAGMMADMREVFKESR